METRLTRPLYRELSSLLAAIANCKKANNGEWLDKHTERALRLVSNHMPSGAGIDTGTKLDMDKSTPERLVFTFGYHHMNETGYYDGWTEHTLIVTPSLLSGIDLRITGRDRNQIKDYLHETYMMALTQDNLPE